MNSNTFFLLLELQLKKNATNNDLSERKKRRKAKSRNHKMQHMQYKEYHVICVNIKLRSTLHTVKFELTNQHLVGGKNCGVLTSRRFCALRFGFCVISEVYTVEVRFYFTVFFKFTAYLTSVY